MTPNETEKIKLMQLFRQGKIDNLPDVDSDEYKASKIKDMMAKANTNESNIEEMTRDTFERMDGLVDQSLLIKFLDTFEEIYGDYVEGGDPFDTSEVIDFLSIMMQNRAQDARLDSRSFGEGVNEEKTISITKDQMEKLHKGEPVKLGNNSFLYKVDAPKKEGVNEGKSREEVESIISKYLDADDTKDYLNMNYDDVKDMSTSDILADLEDTATSAPLASYKRNLQEVDGGVEFFKRIAFKK